MASHGKVFDLFDDRYLELQDVFGNVEPLPSLVPYEQYKSHAITYRMDTSHEIFMALLQNFTERKAVETGKELWTWCVQWEVDETAARQPVAAPHSPKRPRLDSSQPNTPTAQVPRSNAPPITAHARYLDPALLEEEDMLRILVDIVQIDSTVVPNFIEFLYRWIDYYEGDGKALKAALHGEIPSLWDFEYHPLLVPEEIKKKMDEAKGITHDGKTNGPRGNMFAKTRQKPDLAALERKIEESERMNYREVHFGIQPPKMNEPLPPLINIPRDRYKRAKYYAACFKSRQRAFFLLTEAGITPQNMRDYHKFQTMDLKDTPLLVQGDGLNNFEKDAKLAQLFNSLKEQHRAKQLEVSISNQLADEAQVARSTASQGSTDIPLIPATTVHAHHPDMADGSLRKIQQTKDKGHQRVNIVPAPLVGRMKSRLFQGARDKAGLQEMFARSSFLPIPPPPANVDGGRLDDDGDDDGSTDESDDDMSDPRPTLPQYATLPRPSLPSPASLPRPSLPPLPRPPPVMISTQRRDVLSQHRHPSGHVALTAQGAASTVELSPPRVATAIHGVASNHANHAGRLVDMMNQQVDLATNRVRAQQNSQAGQTSAQSLQSESTSGFGASNTLRRLSDSQPSFGLLPYPRPSTPSAPRAPDITVSAPQLSSQYQLPRGFEGDFNPYARSPPPPPGFEHQYQSPSGYGTLHFGHPPPGPPSAWSPSPNHQPSLSQQAQTSPWPMPLRRYEHTPPPAFAQRLAAAQEARVHATSYNQDVQNSGPLLPRAPDLLSLSGPANQAESTQECQQPFSTSLLVPPQTTLQRTAPSPLTLRPSGSPLSSLAPSILATSPFTTSHRGIPVQIYLPRILVPANTIGPGGMKLGNDSVAETDAFLLGHTHPKSGKITLNRAIFLPLGVWTNAQDRVRKGNYTVLESYVAPNRAPSVPHRAVYEKAKQAFEMMIVGSPAARERELTKRWRTSKGRMTATERGAIWEGWAVEIDREIAMSREDRKGAFVQNALVDGIDENSDEMRRRREIDELLETDEAWDYEEEYDDEDEGEENEEFEEGEGDDESEDMHMHG
jgi:hypothetical protein